MEYKKEFKEIKWEIWTKHAVQEDTYEKVVFPFGYIVSWIGLPISF